MTTKELDAASEPSGAATTQVARKKKRPTAITVAWIGLLGAVLAALAAAVLGAVMDPARIRTGNTDSPITATPPTAEETTQVKLRCQEPDCMTIGQQITLEAHTTGRVPEGKDLYLLVYSESDDAWFVFYSIIPNDEKPWTASLGLGNPQPQAKSRLFKLCAYLLPADSVERLKTLQLTNKGKGLKASDLPRDIAELNCIPATRPAGV